MKPKKARLGSRVAEVRLTHTEMQSLFYLLDIAEEAAGDSDAYKADIRRSEKILKKLFKAMKKIERGDHGDN